MSKGAKGQCWNGFTPGEYVDSTEIDFDRLFMRMDIEALFLILIIRWCRTERRRTSGRARFLHI